MKLVRPRATYEVIGDICNNPDLLRDPSIVLTENEFREKYIKIIFTALNNIVFENPQLNRVTAIDIDNYLSGYPDYYKTYNVNKGFEYVNNSIEISNPQLFDAYYRELRMFSLLNMYEENGISVKSLYDEENPSLKEKSEQLKALMNMTEEDVMNYFSSKQYDVRDRWSVMLGKTSSFDAGDGIEETMEENESGDAIGISLASEYQNALFLGAEGGRVLFKSARTGFGKTRNFVEDACAFSCGTLYDLKKREWVKFGSRQPTLFICTELDKKELQNLLLAYLSGISTDIIEKGDYTPATKKRIDEAKAVIKNAPLKLLEMEEFTSAELEMQIEMHILKYGVKNIIVDYIEQNPKIIMELGEKMKGMPLREDIVLLHLSKILKRIAKKYDVFIESGTQRNREEMRDEYSLAGGKSTANKCDHGIILDTPNENDIKKLQYLIDRYGEPNYVESIYKNRKGKKLIYIWSEKNLGNMRSRFLFATDFKYNHVALDRLVLLEEEEEIQADCQEEVTDATYCTPEDEETGYFF